MEPMEQPILHRLELSDQTPPLAAVSPFASGGLEDGRQLQGREERVPAGSLPTCNQCTKKRRISAGRPCFCSTEKRVPNHSNPSAGGPRLSCLFCLVKF